jgi:hypothetical protein
MEYFTSTIVWILAVFGAANGVAVSTLLSPFRRWLTYSKKTYFDDDGNELPLPRKFQFPSKLVHCAMCMGFWIGILFSATAFSPAGYLWGDGFMPLMMDGFLGSSTSWMLYLLLYNKQFQH